MPQITMLPEAPLARAKERAWIAFGSALLDTIGAFYSAPDEATLLRKRDDIAARMTRRMANGSRPA